MQRRPQFVGSGSWRAYPAGVARRPRLATNAQSIGNRSEANNPAKELRRILPPLIDAAFVRPEAVSGTRSQSFGCDSGLRKSSAELFIHTKAVEFTALHDDWLFKIAARAENLRSLSRGRARTVCRAGISKAVCAGRFSS